MESLNLSPLPQSQDPLTDPTALFAVSYGLYIVTIRENGKDSGLVVNTVSQIGISPDLLAVGINKANFSLGVIRRTGKMNVNVLDASAPFSLFQRFGFQSGRDTDKMKGLLYGRSENNLPSLQEHIKSTISLEVIAEVETPSHVLFIGKITESVNKSSLESMTYADYHASVKPKPPKTEEKAKKGWVCRICGYVHEEEELPADFICPICKHPATDFERLK